MWRDVDRIVYTSRFAIHNIITLTHTRTWVNPAVSNPSVSTASCHTWYLWVCNWNAQNHFKCWKRCRRSQYVVRTAKYHCMVGCYVIDLKLHITSCRRALRVCCATCTFFNSLSLSPSLWSAWAQTHKLTGYVMINCFLAQRKKTNRIETERSERNKNENWKRKWTNTKNVYQLCSLYHVVYSTVCSTLHNSASQRPLLGWSKTQSVSITFHSVRLSLFRSGHFRSHVSLAHSFSLTLSPSELLPLLFAH